MGERMHGTTVSKQITYGSISFYQGKKAEEQNSHKWSCYVRGKNDEDISTFVKKVVFVLHPSFKDFQRSIEHPPFEICEVGWGEFDIGIQIHFHDSREKKLEINHLLRLYPQPGESQSTKKPVVSEFYDEVVFTDPYPDFFDRLMNGAGTEPDLERTESPFHQEIKQHFRSYSDEEFVRVLKSIEDAQAYVRDYANTLRDQLRKVDGEIQGLRNSLKEEERKQ